ncbi:uncharacterized protein LOC106474226, partial [Limulus polyphemus]|uniref:Uncharacterized protein LOC106474226 n=1 Tax=Limulus polyphemus TaxID=6850 RepID=A0ABM1TQX8_LIMPO
HGSGKDVSNIDKEARQQIKFSSDIAVDQPGKLVRAPTPYPKELKAHAKHARNYALKLQENGREGSEEPVVENKETEEIMINGDLPESFVVRTGVSEARVKVKEAKVTKPKCHSLSPHLNERHLLYKHDKSDTDTSVELPLVVKTSPIRESKGNASSSERSLDSLCVSVKSSPSQGVAQPPDNHDSPNLRVSTGFVKNRGATSTRFKSRLKREENVDCEQGYRSDHEVYLLHREQLEPQDGYFSDWETEAGREISLSNLHTPLCTRVTSREDPVPTRIPTNGQVPAVHNSASVHNQLQGSAHRWDKSTEGFDYIDNGSENEEQQQYQINERDQHLRPSLPNLQHSSPDEPKDVVFIPETQNQSGSSLSYGSTRGSVQPHYASLQYNPRQSPSPCTNPKRSIGVSPPTVRFPHSHKVNDQDFSQVVLPSQTSLPRPQAQPIPSTKLTSNQRLGFPVVRNHPPLAYSGYPIEVASRFPNIAPSLQDSQMYIPQSSVLPLDVRSPLLTVFHHPLRPPSSHWNLPHYSSNGCDYQEQQSPSSVAVHSHSSSSSGFHLRSPTPSCTTSLSMQEALSHFSTSDIGSHTNIVSSTDHPEQIRRYHIPLSNYRNPQEGNSLTFGTKPQLSCSETYQHVSQVITTHPGQELQWYDPAGAASQSPAIPKGFLSPGSSASWTHAESSVGNQQNRPAGYGLVTERTNPPLINDVEYCQSGSFINSFCPSSGNDRPSSVRSSLSRHSSRPSSFSSMNSASPDSSTKQLLGPPRGDPSQCYINGLDICVNFVPDAQESPAKSLPDAQEPPAKSLPPSPREKSYNEDKLLSSDPPPLPPKPSFQTAGLLHGKDMEGELPVLKFRSLPVGAREYGQSVEQQQSNHLLDSKQITERLHDIHFSPILPAHSSKHENKEVETHTSHSIQVDRVVSEGKRVSPCSSSGARTVNCPAGVETQFSPTGSLFDNHRNEHDEGQSSPQQLNKPWIFGTHKNTQVCPVMITKNPDLGFSITGGAGNLQNPNKLQDTGIYVSHVEDNGPASTALRPGDKILQVSF